MQIFFTLDTYNFLPSWLIVVMSSKEDDHIMHFVITKFRDCNFNRSSSELIKMVDEWLEMGR